MNTLRRCFLTLAAAALLAGCATTSDLAQEDADALESYNRAMFAFNDAVDKAVFKPVAKVYWRVLPEPVTDSIGNFFSNLNDVVVLVNDLLQFKLHQAAKEAFSALGTQKIPKVKEIQAEYDALREKKKQAYAAYHQAQDEMRQLLTVRANVERILGVEEKEKERQKEKKKER